MNARLGELLELRDVIENALDSITLLIEGVATDSESQELLPTAP